MMRRPLIMVGIAAMVVIAGGWFAASRSFTPASSASDSIGSNAPMAATTLSLTSTDFTENGRIPAKFTCDGEQVNPHLQLSGVPEDAKTLALIMDDPDVPKQLKPDGVFDHWILFNIPPATREIAMGSTVGTAGQNGAGKSEYAGPCPPPQYEPAEHRYFFKLYALDTELPLKVGASKTDVLREMNGHIVAQTQLVGRYSRK